MCHFCYFLRRKIEAFLTPAEFCQTYAAHRVVVDGVEIAGVLGHLSAAVAGWLRAGFGCQGGGEVLLAAWHWQQSCCYRGAREERRWAWLRAPGRKAKRRLLRPAHLGLVCQKVSKALMEGR